jgi:uncharacterized MnhB-related membrane protein
MALPVYMYEPVILSILSASGFGLIANAGDVALPECVLLTSVAVTVYVPACVGFAAEL